MFPNPKHPPTGCPKRPVDQFVTSLVRLKFLIPEFRVVFRFCCMLRAGMPKTPIDENRNPKFWKNEIGFAKDRLMAPPAGDASVLRFTSAVTLS